MTRKSAFRTCSDASRFYERIEIIAPTALILCLVLACIVWVDIVVRANGIVVPEESSRPITATRDGIVARFHVRDGDAVEAGALLVTLEDALLDEQIRATRDGLAEVEMEQVALRGLLRGTALSAIEVALAEVARRHDGADPGDWVGFARAEQDLQASVLDRAGAVVRTLEAREAALLSDIGQVEHQLELLSERHRSVAELSERGWVSQFARIDADIELGELERDLAQLSMSRAQLTEELGLQAVENDLARSRQQASWQARLIEAAAREQSLGARLAELEALEDRLRITAPLSGIVQETAVAQLRQRAGSERLMVIVPSDYGLRIDARLPGRDIAFVEPGQSAKVLLSSYSLTRYGTVDAVVRTISTDATQRSSDDPVALDTSDERRLMADVKDLQMLPSYQVTLDVAQATVGGITLRPGMTAVANIRTGERRLIEYFLDPLLRARHSSLGER